MTESQQIEFNKLKTQVDTIGETMHKMASKTDGIYYALIGNDLSKDGGLVQQIKDMETRQEEFEKEISFEVSEL